MAPLLTCKDLKKAFASRDLFEGLSFSLFAGDRVGLLGPNGAGKSTLLKILGEEEFPDEGEVMRAKGLRVCYVSQGVEPFSGSIEEAVVAALKEEPLEMYEKHSRARGVLGSLGFSDPQMRADALSGGWKRRLSLARALVVEPDLLFLDEPTNHLDLDGILWLESFLVRNNLTFVLTSHDRLFLEKVTNKTWELSRRYPGGMFCVEGGYADFIGKKEAFLEAQAGLEKSLRSKSRREEEWLKQNPKARSTKSRSRIQEAIQLRHELAKVKVRNAISKAQISLEGTERQTKKLLTAKNLGKTTEGSQLFSGMDITLTRGDRFGIVGENGSGKTTLLKILAGELTPDAGTLKYADNLRVFYFDQLREKLDLELPLRLGLAPDGEVVHFRGSKIHVNAWCERFLFDKTRLDQPMKVLSGGERARVVISRLMIRPADVLLLDEPTNDLDIETLEMLEESLDEFPGAVILVTHDRAMMDRIADQVLRVGNEEPRRFNTTDAWLAWRKEQARQKEKKPKEVREASSKKGLSYKEQQALKNVEKNIHSLEQEIASLHVKLETLSGADLTQACETLSQLEGELEGLMEEWERLEEKKG